MKVEEIKAELKKKVPVFAQKVAPLYVTLNWQWERGNTPPHIPSIDEIAKTLYELIDDLTEEYCGHGLGGLEVYYDEPTEEESGSFGLRFTLEEIESFD